MSSSAFICMMLTEGKMKEISTANNSPWRTRCRILAAQLEGWIISSCLSMSLLLLLSWRLFW